MENREAGLQVLFNRVKDAREVLGVATFRRTPAASVEEEDLLCVYMLEGKDTIVQRSARNWLGYPARRELEVYFELVSAAGFDIRAFYTQFRAVVLDSPELLKGCTVREDRAEGPRNYQKPNIIGMLMVLTMTYMDNG